MVAPGQYDFCRIKGVAFDMPVVFFPHGSRDLAQMCGAACSIGKQIHNINTPESPEPGKVDASGDGGIIF